MSPVWHVVFLTAGALCYLAGQYAARRSFEWDQFVLRLLAKYGECHGLNLVEWSGGQLRRGTVYVRLRRLEESGLLSSREESALPPQDVTRGSRPRVLYRLTEQGRLWALASMGDPERSLS